MVSKNRLFNEKTIQRLIFSIKPTSKQKKASKKWINLMDKGELMKEKRGYLKFYDIILKEILNYDKLEHEKENVEFTYEKDGKSLVRIEAKGMNTKDLFAPQKRINPESPVDQLWRYMNSYATSYGIVTNYKLFILFKYNVGKLKYHLFDFEDIKNNLEKLKEFIAIFSRESIDNGFVENLYEKSIIEERKFTKEFYKLYHETRLMMIKEFQENGGVSGEGAVHFAQLFLNRLMFIFFSEDTGKLEKRIAENRILEMLKNVKLFSSNTKNISNTVVNLFNDVNKGSNFPIKIFGFNGGLFKHPIPSRIFFKDFRDKKFYKEVYQYSKLKKDLKLNEKEKEIFNKYGERLNPIIKNILLMASFDFNTEINVNILGHIFEQSISDIEDLQADKTSRRKKEGIFYTPEYITDYICRNTIVPYLSKKGVNDVSDLIKEYSNNIGELEEKFKQMKILDPACGSGAFLIKAIDIMLEIFKAVQDFKQWKGEYSVFKLGKSKLGRGRLAPPKSLENSQQLALKKWNEEDEAKKIIGNNIHGVDINEESVEITRLSLFLKMARKNKKLTDLSNNIKQGNSLIDDKSIDKRGFNWKKEFPFKFGVVIGNPPYVRADVDDKKYREQRAWMVGSEKYKTLYEKWDLYLAFIEKGINLLAKNGKFSMIIPDAFSTAKYAAKMRKFLAENQKVRQIDYFPQEYLFEGVGVKNIILFLDENKVKFTNKIIHKNILSIDKRYAINLKESGENGFRMDYLKEKREYGDSELLGDICFISKGMVLNSDEIKYKGEFKKNDLISDKKDEKHPKRYIEAKNTQRYLIRKIRFLEWNTNRVPKKISRKTFPELYEEEKIMKGRITEALYDNSGILTNDSIYILKRFIDLNKVRNKSIESSIKKNNKKSREKLEKISHNFNLKYILAILNSKWALNFLKSVSRNRISFYPDDLRKIPIKNTPQKQQKLFIEKADLMLKLNKEFYEKKDKFLRLIKQEFRFDKISNKLDNFYELSFDKFVKEIEKKSGKNISLNKKSELMNLFDRNKKEISELKERIDKTDEEIEKMVYKIYSN